MERKTFKNLGKIIMALAVVICAVVIANGVRVHADNGETVRVTNAKELTAAMKNAEVGTIILRTQVYQTITIKANKASKNQFLIIDAPNTVITNKAVFANINIFCIFAKYDEMRIPHRYEQSGECCSGSL